MPSEELTDLQRHERYALCGDRNGISQVVSGLREYRDLFDQMLADVPSERRETWRDYMAEIEALEHPSAR